MAPMPSSQDLAFRARSTSEPQGHTKASTSKQIVNLLATLNEGTAASIDVTYKVVWTAAEPPCFWRPRPSFLLTVREPRSSRPERPAGSIRITGSAAEGSIWSKFQSQDTVRSAATPQSLPEGKIPCIAMVHRGSLGALSTCVYDKATDNFHDFSINDGRWSHQKGYHDYGDIQMSTRKWFQGSWVSVEDDNKNEFLFLTVERDHGVVRVWRPNMVAKRVVGVGETDLTYEEGMRLGLNEDDGF